MELPKISEIITHLENNVQGQTHAKRTLAKAVHNHILQNLSKERKLTFDNGYSSKPTSNHTLLIGPTGSGKTFLVKTLASFLKIPIITVNCSSITATGYYGEGINDILKRVYDKIKSSKEKSKYAIIFLDEFDKLSSRNSFEGLDIKTTSVQQELLSLFDDSILKRDSKKENSYEIDMSKIIVIACGVFEGLEDVISKRLKLNVLGFVNQSEKINIEDSVTSLVIQEDIHQHGFIKELVARLTNYSTLEKINKDEIINLIKFKLNSPLKYYHNYFGIHDIKISFNEELIEHIAQITAENEFGLRLLNTNIRKLVSKIDWDIERLSKDKITKLSFVYDDNEDDYCKILETKSKLVIARNNNFKCSENLRLYKEKSKDSNKKKAKKTGSKSHTKEINKLLKDKKLKKYKNKKAERFYDKTIKAYGDPYHKKTFLEKLVNSNLESPIDELYKETLNFPNYNPLSPELVLAILDYISCEGINEIPDYQTSKSSKESITLKGKLKFLTSPTEAKYWWLLCEENAIQNYKEITSLLDETKFNLSEIYISASIINTFSPQKAILYQKLRNICSKYPRNSKLISLNKFQKSKILYEKYISNSFFNSFVNAFENELEFILPKTPILDSYDPKNTPKNMSTEQLWNEVKEIAEVFCSMPSTPTRETTVYFLNLIANLIKTLEGTQNYDTRINQLLKILAKATKKTISEYEIHSAIENSLK